MGFGYDRDPMVRWGKHPGAIRRVFEHSPVSDERAVLFGSIAAEKPLYEGPQTFTVASRKHHGARVRSFLHRSHSVRLIRYFRRAPLQRLCIAKGPGHRASKTLCKFRWKGGVLAPHESLGGSRPRSAFPLLVMLLRG